MDKPTEISKALDAAFAKVFHAHPMAGRFDNVHGDEHEVPEEVIDAARADYIKTLWIEAQSDLFCNFTENKSFDAVADKLTEMRFKMRQPADYEALGKLIYSIAEQAAEDEADDFIENRFDPNAGDF